MFAVIYRHWIWMGVPAAVLAAAALAFVIHGVVMVVKRAHLLRVPVVEVQEVRFAEAGRVVLSLEGPRLSTRFRGLAFELRSSDGALVEGRRVFFRARTSGVSTARTELLKYDLPAPGRYILRIHGFKEASEAGSRHAIVFMKPHLMPSIAYILGIVLASVLVTSIVFFALRLRGTAAGG